MNTATPDPPLSAPWVFSEEFIARDAERCEAMTPPWEAANPVTSSNETVPEASDLAPWERGPDDDRLMAEVARKPPPRPVLEPIGKAGKAIDGLAAGEVILMFGKHRGKTVSEVDATPGGRSYLLWIVKESNLKKGTKKRVNSYLKST